MRLESLTMCFCQFIQTHHNSCRAALFSVIQWSATKRCEARAKNDAGVEKVGISDDLVVQTGDGFVDHGENQAILYVGGHILAITGGFDRGAVLPLLVARS